MQVIFTRECYVKLSIGKVTQNYYF